MADPLTTTLVLMYFITAPAKNSAGRESKEIRESKSSLDIAIERTTLRRRTSTHCVLYGHGSF